MPSQGVSPCPSIHHLDLIPIDSYGGLDVRRLSRVHSPVLPQHPDMRIDIMPPAKEYEPLGMNLDLPDDLVGRTLPLNGLFWGDPVY